MMKTPDGSKRTKKKKADGSIRQKKTTKTPVGKDSTPRDVCVRKKKGDGSVRKKKTKAEASVRKVREKKEEEETEKFEDACGQPDSEDRLPDTELLKVPKHMSGVTPEQTAAYEKFAKNIFALGVDGLLKEYVSQLKSYPGQPLAREVFDKNVTRNRYKDVICNDHTRVVIADGKQPEYIHANYVRGEPLFNEFICTQGPMTTTLVDFWRMIMHLRCHHIVMLCETIEYGKVKCEQYWPLQKGEKKVFGEMTIEHVGQNDKDSQFVTTQLQISNAAGEQHLVRHHHWKKWPDRSIPKTAMAVLRILRCVRYSKTPVVVHCSAGVGRTGTLVAVEMCLQSILATGQLNLIAVCKRLRDQRMHVLQVDTQYVFLAQAVLEYGRAIGYLENAELLEELAKFRAALEGIVKQRDEAGQPISQSPATTQPPSGRPSAEPTTEPQSTGQ